MPLNSARSLAKVRMALAEATWPLSTVLLSRISAVVMSKLSLAAWMKRVAGVDDPLEVLAGAAERLAHLVDGGAQRLLVDRLDGVGEVGRAGSRSRSASGCSPGDLRVVVQVGLARRPAAAARRTARPPRSGCRRRPGCRPGSSRSRSRCRGRRRRPRRSARASRPADADAAVGDLAAGEDAAGLREVRDDGVGVVDDEPVEPGVAGPDEGHAEQRDDDEDDAAGSWYGG